MFLLLLPDNVTFDVLAFMSCVVGSKEWSE